MESLLRYSASAPNVIAIGGGLPAAELFPRKRFAAAFLHAMREPGCRALQYDWPEGHDVLRSWVAERLRARGAEVSADEVIMTSGAQQGLSLAAQALFTKGSHVGVEPETYPAALELFRRLGAALVVGAQAVTAHYVVDGILNPRGQSLPAATRARLLASGQPLIVDEAYAELAFSGALPRPLIADARDRAFHVGTLSKTLSPGLRVGWLVPPRQLVKRVIELKQTADLQTSSIGQSVAECLLAHDDYDKRLEHERQFYQRRAEALIRAVERWLPEWRFGRPEGGFSIYVETDAALPADKTELAWLRAAVGHGVSFDPGSLFRSDRAERPFAMRLCYSATPPRKLLEAVRRLATAWAEFRA